MSLEHPPHSNEHREVKRDNNLEYPREYFEVQVAFALKWASLAEVDARDVLEQKTALARRVDTSAWDQWGQEVDKGESVDALTDTLYDAYTGSTEAIVQPLKSEPSSEIFGSEYFPYTQTIKVHFLGQPRGSENILSEDKTTARRESAQRAVAQAYRRHPEAQHVVGGSWLYNLESYRDSFPPAFTQDLRRLVPKELTETSPNSVPGMTFTGNSLWGQFVNRHGWARSDRYAEFMDSVANAQTLDELINAFPLKPLYASTTPEKFLADTEL